METPTGVSAYVERAIGGVKARLDEISAQVQVVDERMEPSMAELKNRVELFVTKMDERMKLLMTKMDIIIGALGIESASAPDATRMHPQTPPPASAPTPQTPLPASPTSPPELGYRDDEDTGVVVDSEYSDSDAGEDAGTGEDVMGKKRATATNAVEKPNAKKRATATNAAEKPDTKKRTTATTPAKKPAAKKLTEKQREYLTTTLTFPLHVKKMTTEEGAALCKNFLPETYFYTNNMYWTGGGGGGYFNPRLGSNHPQIVESPPDLSECTAHSYNHQVLPSTRAPAPVYLAYPHKEIHLYGES